MASQNHHENHRPVMLSETLEGLAVKAGRWYIDGTFGAGGHSRAILDTGASVLAIDQDPNARRYWLELQNEPANQGRFLAVEGNFRELDVHAERFGVAPVAGVLLDLGVSSMQLDEAERGFAFRQEGPLDMRMGGDGRSAADLVNGATQEELAEIIYRYGEERHSRRIARAIAESREKTPIATTQQLADLIQRAYPRGQRRDHPARRTFQALRIAVNDELGALQAALQAAERVLAEAGRLAVLSYHSLEDRIVKHALRESGALHPLTKKPILALEAEVLGNPRARSAKLRVAEKRSAENRSAENRSEKGSPA